MGTKTAKAHYILSEIVSLKDKHIHQLHIFRAVLFMPMAFSALAKQDRER
jgi:hypothetical protein